VVSRCETKASYRYSVRGDIHNWDTRGSFDYRKVESVMPSIQLRRIARRRNSSSKKVSFNEAAKSIAEGVRGNWASRWWLKPEYLEGRYDRGEVEHAFDEVLRVFDHEWLESLMSKFAEGRARDHFYLRQFIGEGLYPLTILFSLGQDLLAIKSLEGYDQLKERLRSDVGWMSAAFEAEFAAHCVRKGLQVRLYPAIPNSERRPDLLVSVDSHQVYVELKEIHPSDERLRYFRALDRLFAQLQDVLPDICHIELTPSRVPRDHEVDSIGKKLRELLTTRQPFPATVTIGNLMVRAVKEKREKGKSFALSDLAELALKEFKRLEDTLRKKGRQLPWPYLGMLVIDATNTLGGVHEDDIKYVAERTFRKHPRPNILGAFIIRSYKFYRREAEPEAIYIRNPHCGEAGLGKLLSDFRAFSRTRSLV